MEREMSRSRTVGTLALALGIAQIILTMLTVLLVLAGGFSMGSDRMLKGLATFGLATLMSSSLVACGHELQKIRAYTSAAVADIRALWTVMVLAMVIGCVGGYWLAPPLLIVGSIMLVALMFIRGPIINLSR